MGIGKQAKTLKNKQLEAILAYLETTRYPTRNKVIFLLSFKAGLRAKEIALLTWKMVCDSNGNIASTINLPNCASKGKSGRVIPMHEDLMNALKDLAARTKINSEKRVIQTERSQTPTPQVIVNFFRNVYHTMGFTGCSSHSGRRTFITNAARNISKVGGSINDVKALAGHSSLGITQRYIEYDTDAQRKVVDLV